MMPARDIVVEREDRDGGLADREGRRRDHRRQQSLEPLARLGQLGRDARAAGMDLGADMVGDEAHDALAIGGVSTLAGIDKAGSTSRSIQSRPSGLSITSTTAGSSSHAAMAGPSAVRSMRAPRVAASALDDAVPILPPSIAPAREAGPDIGDE